MERLIDRLRARWRRCGLRRRWLRSAFAPAAALLLLALGALALYLRAQNPEQSGAALAALLIGVAACLVSWLLGERFLRTLLEPLRRLSAQCKRIAEGNYGSQAEKLREDELGDLTDGVNEMSASLARSETLQTEFISTVSHELRTPLTAITGWAEALAFDEALQGESRRGVEIISKEANRLTKMVGELLEFTRIQDGRFHLDMETVDLAAELEDAIYTYSSLLMQENLALHYVCTEEELPPIEGDGERLKQVFLNLIDNAAKYGRAGESIDVSLSREGAAVVVCIRDHGAGILPEELPHVKERFYKGSGKARGSGIGLAICEEIVSRHGGALLIENAKDGGVRATVKLPLKP